VVREHKLEARLRTDERSRWLATLTLQSKEEYLFEFEMYLKGLAYYFNLHNLPIDDLSAAAARDFWPSCSP